MSFKTDKRRIQFIKNREISNQMKAERQKIENSFINKNVIQLAPNHSVFKKHGDLSFDWQNMTVATFFDANESLNTQYINWEITFDRFDERLIPLIQTEVIYRQSGGGDDGITLLATDKIVLFEIEDLPDSEIMKKVIMRVNFYFGETWGQADVEAPYEAKLIVKLIPHQDLI